VARRRQPEVTRAQILDAARTFFGQYGYASTNTEELVRSVGLTRGALYHHFRDKKDLFRGVVELVIEESVEKVSADHPREPENWEAVIDGTLTYLDLSLQPGNLQILAIDAPSVFGLQSVVEMSERARGNQWEATLQACMKKGIIDRLPLAATGHVLAAAVAESAIYITAAQNPAKARKDVRRVLVRLMEGLRARG
jgi:AcrR family transcriptional regulator